MQRRGYLWEEQSYPLMQQSAMAVMGWAGWENCLPSLLTSILTCTHSAHQLPDIRQVPTFHSCSGNFPVLTIIKWEWGKHMAQRDLLPSPVSSTSELNPSWPAFIQLSQTPLVQECCKQALWCCSPFSAAKFLLKSDLHFPCCNLLFFIQLTADRSQAIPSLQQAFPPSRVTQPSQETRWQLPLFQLAVPHPIS